MLDERTVSSYGIVQGCATPIRVKVRIRGGMPDSESSPSWASSESVNTEDEFYYNAE